jgi:adenosylhomocysteine nucleosidase
MAILYVAALAMELEPFANMLTGLRKLKWPIDYAFEGVWEGRRIMLAANGAGPKLAAQAVEVAIRAVAAAELSASKLEAVVSTGYCGALDPDLREFQIVAPSEVLDLKSKQTFECAPPGTDSPHCSGLLVSEDRVVSYTPEKQKLRMQGAIAVDMESAGVAARTSRAGLPFYCIKVVSDRADESFPLDINNMRTKEGRIQRVKIGLHALTHPNIVPSLLHWKRRTEDAAKALGSFLVSCPIKPKPVTEPDTASAE